MNTTNINLDLNHNHVILDDNLNALKSIPNDSINLIYIDPPFNTGKTQSRTQIKTVKNQDGDRIGFQQNTYKTIKIGTQAFNDNFDDFLEFLQPRLIEAHRILSPTGSLFLHIDYREVHYVKILLDSIFGRESFQNEIIWAYDYGARSKTKWPTKHDNILWFSKNPTTYTFNLDECDRIPYMAPQLVGEEKAQLGKTPTDVWWHTIVSPTGKEKTGYPTQKPIGIIKRIIKVHSNPNDIVLDFFAGSGTTGLVAAELSRKFILIDQLPNAISIIKMRLKNHQFNQHNCQHINPADNQNYSIKQNAFS